MMIPGIMPVKGLSILPSIEKAPLGWIDSKIRTSSIPKPFMAHQMKRIALGAVTMINAVIENDFM